MYYVDSHTHLNSDQLYSQWVDIMKQCNDHHLVGLVNIGVDSVYNDRGIEIARESKQLFPQMNIGCTVGIHPCEVTEKYYTKDMIDVEIAHIDTLISCYPNDIWGIGECGTDLHWPCTDEQHQLQQYATHCQAKLAQKYQLPLIIHSRSDRDGTYEVLKEYHDIVINLHCRNYTPVEIQIALDTWGDHVYFGFGGILTYPKAGEVRNSLMSCPIGQIVLETDAPYLSPQSHRGGNNYPYYIDEIYKKASEILAVDGDVLCRQIEENRRRLYQLKDQIKAS